jgi:hypothetical protein
MKLTARYKQRGPKPKCIATYKIDTLVSIIQKMKWLEHVFATYNQINYIYIHRERERKRERERESRLDHL